LCHLFITRLDTSVPASQHLSSWILLTGQYLRSDPAVLQTFTYQLQANVVHTEVNVTRQFIINIQHVSTLGGCSNFNLYNYSCVDEKFYVIYNNLIDFHTTGWILLEKPVSYISVMFYFPANVITRSTQTNCVLYVGSQCVMAKTYRSNSTEIRIWNFCINQDILLYCLIDRHCWLCCSCVSYSFGTMCLTCFKLLGLSLGSFLGFCWFF